MLKLDSVMVFVRKNFILIAVGLCAVVLLYFMSANFSGAEDSSLEYSSELEIKLEAFLSSLQGVGSCDVIIFTNEAKSSSFASVKTESIGGIAVICDGGGDILVKNSVSEVLTRLFGISGSRISVNKSSK